MFINRCFLYAIPVIPIERFSLNTKRFAIVIDTFRAN